MFVKLSHLVPAVMLWNVLSSVTNSKQILSDFSFQTNWNLTRQALTKRKQNSWMISLNTVFMKKEIRGAHWCRCNYMIQQIKHICLLHLYHAPDAPGHHCPVPGLALMPKSISHVAQRDVCLLCAETTMRSGRVWVAEKSRDTVFTHCYQHTSSLHLHNL